MQQLLLHRASRRIMEILETSNAFMNELVQMLFTGNQSIVRTIVNSVAGQYLPCHGAEAPA
jgi:hypothetical protein